jgi:hypothetical protein
LILLQHLAWIKIISSSTKQQSNLSAILLCSAKN